MNEKGFTSEQGEKIADKLTDRTNTFKISLVFRLQDQGYIPGDPVTLTKVMDLVNATLLDAKLI